ncbi:MAG TPA: hypothetical protein VJ867_15985, partial [Gemmatimonadaceae bacterium]|nr:hypothetical protein [Gemmatimonadaceae bacterium]
PRSWGATTRRGDSVFVHVLDWPDRALALPIPASRIKTATDWKTGARVALTSSPAGVTLSLPPRARDDFDQNVVLVTAH